MLTRPEGRVRPVRILPVEGAHGTLDFGDAVTDFCKL